MRVLMTTTGYAGHFVPLVPFARACVRAGHEVRVAVPRSRAGIVESAGLQPHPCADPAPEDLGRLVAALAELSQRDGHAHMMREGFARVAARAVLPDVLDIVDTWRPDVVVRESQEYTGAAAAERAGIPHVRVALGLAAQEEETLAHAAAAVDELRGELGLPADPDAGALRDSPLLTLVPSALEDPDAASPRATHRFRAGAPRPAPPSSEDPLVYLTFGSVTTPLRLFPRVYRAALDALAGVPAHVLVTVGDDADPAALDPLPPNVRVERWIPQEVVMRDAAAIVCHGGYGSVLGALAHGVPVVALPMFADDQWRNARRVAELGAGIVLGDDRAREGGMLDGPRPEALAALPAAVEAALRDPGYRHAAGGLAGAIAALPPVDAAAGVLEAIARAPGRHQATAQSATPGTA